MGGLENALALEMKPSLSAKIMLATLVLTSRKFWPSLIKFFERRNAFAASECGSRICSSRSTSEKVDSGVTLTVWRVVVVMVGAGDGLEKSATSSGV